MLRVPFVRVLLWRPTEYRPPAAIIDALAAMQRAQNPLRRRMITLDVAKRVWREVLDAS